VLDEVLCKWKVPLYPRIWPVDYICGHVKVVQPQLKRSIGRDPDERPVFASTTCIYWSCIGDPLDYEAVQDLQEQTNSACQIQSQDRSSNYCTTLKESVPPHLTRSREPDKLILQCILVARTGSPKPARCPEVVIAAKRAIEVEGELGRGPCRFIKTILSVFDILQP
jgi:hypothetical protein